MSEWLTYSLSDFLLFSPSTYYRLFELYNLALWPGQILAVALGFAVLALALRGPAWRGRAIAAILAACWLWVAWAYLLERYDTINWAAEYFALAFALEALLLIGAGALFGGLALRSRPDLFRRAGLCIFLFALLVQPLIGPLVGRTWTQTELFALAPDPTAIGTLGILLAADKPLWLLLVVPLLWCALSGATLWTMESPDALVTPGVAVLVLALAIWKTLSRRAHQQ
ncbi:MAG: DUF6064 family protein [Pseudomonadota bacterium]